MILPNVVGPTKLAGLSVERERASPRQASRISWLFRDGNGDRDESLVGLLLHYLVRTVMTTPRKENERNNANGFQKLHFVISLAGGAATSSRSINGKLSAFAYFPKTPKVLRSSFQSNDESAKNV